LENTHLFFILKLVTFIHRRFTVVSIVDRCRILRQFSLFDLEIIITDICYLVQNEFLTKFERFALLVGGCDMNLSERGNLKLVDNPV